MDTHVLLYSEPHALPFSTPVVAPPLPFSTPVVAFPRESALGATEPCLLRLSRTGLHGAGDAPHLILSSVRRPDIALHTFHASCLGPLVLLHKYFGQKNGMQPTPGTVYVVIYGNHLRRGLTIRFPPETGERLMPL